MSVDPWKNQGTRAYLHYRAGIVESNGDPASLYSRNAYFLAFNGKKLCLSKELATLQRKDVLGVVSLEGGLTGHPGLFAQLYGNCSFVNGKDKVVNGQRYFALNEPVELQVSATGAKVLFVMSECDYRSLDELVKLYSMKEPAKLVPPKR